MSGPSTGFGPGLGYDPARTESLAKEKSLLPSRLELPASAFKVEGQHNFRHYDRDTDIAKYNFPTELPERPGFNKSGKEITVRLNQFKVTQWPQKKVYQYDVMVGNGAEKRGLIKAAWCSKAVQSKLRLVDDQWLFDWNRIGWCAGKAPRDEVRILVDLDAEKGQTSRPGRENTVRVVIRLAKEINMAVINGYLERKMPFDNSVLEAVNFLDHLMRQWPSEQYTSIKRSFFSRLGERFALDELIEATKGVYSSMRLNDPKGSFGTSSGLAVNVDVANSTFWSSQPLHQAARNLGKDRNRNLSYTLMRDLLAPVKDKTNGSWTMSQDFRELRKMQKLRFSVKHRGKENVCTYTIKKFLFDPQLGQQGAHAKTVKFAYKDRSKPNAEEVQMSIYDYFLKTYNIRLEHWYLPLVETTKAGIFPMELCTVIPNQQYMQKLSPDQTAKMIKFAVTRPKERLAAVNFGIRMLKWTEDPCLLHYGVKISTDFTQSKARLLPNPEVQFTGSKVNPGTTGRWDLRGKKFLEKNPKPLSSWGVCIVDQCVDNATISNFLTVFIQTYIGHGGQISNRSPFIYNHQKNTDLGAAVQATRLGAGNAAKSEPQILMFILPERNFTTYERIKKSMDCRFGIVSQCLARVHVVKAQPQYCSNVCMKFNAKLGGTTCKVAGKTQAASAGFFTVPTIIIGADVSHPSPGSPQASMAAITMSMDKEACRYAAAVQTNGIRVEMITKNNITSMLMPLLKTWVKTVGGGTTGPKHIYYFRDGVSEGQYLHVLEQEVADMKAAILATYKADVKFTVVICSKRHHLRIFPKENDNVAGDKNGNPLPGVLVERDVTHPFEYDFYLNSHSAIQGTARPVHYHVLMDEAKTSPDALQKMIYHQCYQYMRSTTPVSLHPAVYYAHLASNRARAHEDVPSSDGPRGGQKFVEANNLNRAAGKGGLFSETDQSRPRSTEASQLLGLGSMASTPAVRETILNSMWYI